MKLDNGFIKKHHAFVEWDMPLTWWSRPYEYAWVMERINKNDVVIDAGCGIEHPLKWKMAEKCKKVVAIDADARIKLMMGTDLTKNIEYIYGDIRYMNSIIKADKIVCCSVIEHLKHEEIIETLKCFKDCIKDDGKILLTCDYPTLSPIWLLARACEIGLRFEEPFCKPNDREISELISGYNLNVFTLVLEKA